MDGEATMGFVCLFLRWLFYSPSRRRLPGGVQQAKAAAAAA
jgi:hypothetical protein